MNDDREMSKWYDTKRAGTVRCPDDERVGNKLGGNIVHHQCEKCLICIPNCFEDSGNHTPNCTCQNGYVYGIIIKIYKEYYAYGGKTLDNST